MRRLMLATLAGAALLTGATAASAQTFYGDGYAYGGGYAYGDGYASTDGYVYNRGPWVERGVGLQVGPVGVGVYADRPAYSDRYYRTERDDMYNSRAFQRGWSQTPPSVGGN